MKATTYSALVMLLFMRNLRKGRVPSLQNLIDLVDTCAKETFHLTVDISRDTKYRLIRELIKTEILDNNKEDGYLSVALSDKTEKYISEFMTIMIHEEEDEDEEDTSQLY